MGFVSYFMPALLAIFADILLYVDCCFGTLLIIKSLEKNSIAAALVLDAFALFKQRKMLVFFIFAMFLGAALQITNTFGGAFLTDFGKQKIYVNSFAVNHPGILISVSQISET